MPVMVVPPHLLRDRSTYKLTQVAKRVAIPRDIVGTDWAPVAQTCRDDLGIEFDGWQDGTGQLMLARSTAAPLDDGGMLAHTIGGFHIAAARQIGKTYYVAGSFFGLCQHYPGLLIIWTAHHTAALDCDTELLTTNRGWVTMGTVRVGDSVLHPNGKATKVTGVSPIMQEHDCFEVTTTDGRKVIADAGHLWTVTDSYRKASSGSGPDRKRWLVPETITTAEMYQRGIGCTGVVRTRGRQYRTNKYRFTLPHQRRVETLSSQHLPIDPYLLGAWLGDGTSSGSTLTCAGEDLNHWQREIAKTGYLPVGYKSLDKAWTVAIRCAGGAGLTSRSFRGKLNDLGVLNNKHIPDIYLIGSVDQRLALLQGLMDTDGTITKEGTARFGNTLRNLSEGVLFLARSLGWRAVITEVKPKSVKRQTFWLVTFTPKLIDGIAPFRMERKIKRIEPAVNRDGVLRDNVSERRFGVSIKSIEPVATRPVRCIKVAEPDGLFLAGRDLIPTHNTSDETFEAIQGFAARTKIAPHIEFIHTGSGDEEVRFWNGSRILFGARERGFGRGIPGVDVMMFDEGQIMSQKAMNNMIATMNTSWLGLHVYAGTPPPTEEIHKAESWMRSRDEAWVIVDPGVVTVETEDLVWIEFGADDAADLDDPEQWVKSNPSFPHRTPIQAFQRLRRKLNDEGFRREGLGLYDENEGSIFNMAKWNTLVASDAGEPDRAALVLDVSPDRKWAAIGIASEYDDDRSLVMVMSISGTAEVVAKIVDLNEKRDLIDIAITPGAARALETTLIDAGIEYEIMTASEVGASFGTFQEAIKNGKLVHLDQGELNFALANTRSRYLQTGESETFDRRQDKVSSLDISPGVAAACALYRFGLNNFPMPYLG